MKERTFFFEIGFRLITGLGSGRPRAHLLMFLIKAVFFFFVAACRKRCFLLPSFLKSLRCASSLSSYRVALVGPSSTNENYATKLDLAEAAHVVTEPGFLCGAAEKDAIELGLNSVDTYLGDVKLRAAR